MERIKLSRKSLLYLGIILVIALFVFAILLYYFLQKTSVVKTPDTQQTNATRESIIKSLSAPEGTKKPVSIEVLNSLSAPSGQTAPEKTSENILKNLSAPK